jgi:hypothetical protein
MRKPKRGAAMMRAFYGSPSQPSVPGRLDRRLRAGAGRRGGVSSQRVHNLQVWPTDTPRAVILNFMNAFDRSLGVECNYCHVERDGKFDFASDDKREKRVARKMILLRDSINVALPRLWTSPWSPGRRR